MIGSVHFLNNSLENLFKNLGDNGFYYRGQEFNANVLDLLKKTGFFLITTAIVLKNSKNAYLAKINFVIHWLIVQLMITTMNIFLIFGKLLKWTLWKIIII